MAAASLSLVNQKVAYCRALMKLLREQPTPQKADERLARQALLDAGAFHLFCAYRHYLRELAENHSLMDVGRIQTERDLMQSLERSGRHSSEAGELNTLRADPQSWLTALCNANDAFWRPPLAETVQRIEVVDLEAPQQRSGPISRESLEAWLQAFNALVERQRETSAEY